MKGLSSYVKLGLWTIVGGFIGAALGVGSALLPDTLDSFGPDIWAAAIDVALWIQILLGLVTGAICLRLMQKVKKWKSLYNADENSTEKLVDKAQNLVLILGGINMALQFVLFGLSIDARNSHMIASVAAFIVFTIMTVVIEIVLVKQVQSMNPLKKGDPGDLRFAKDWTNSCDEAEQLQMYRGGYKTMLRMNKAIIVFLTFALISKTLYGTGNMAIVLLGGLWLFQNVSYCIDSTKEEKKNR